MIITQFKVSSIFFPKVFLLLILALQM